MLDQARALDPLGEYYLVSDRLEDECTPSSFDIILAAFTFDNIANSGPKADALSWLRTLLASDGCVLLVVSSPVIYVNEWASFSTQDFPENREARDGDRLRIVMLDVPDRRPVEDIFCTDVRYRQLFETTGLKVLDVQNPLVTGKEPTQWVSETRAAPVDNLRSGPANHEIKPRRGRGATRMKDESKARNNNTSRPRLPWLICFSRPNRRGPAVAFKITTNDNYPAEETALVDHGLGKANDAATPLHEVRSLSCFRTRMQAV